VGIDVKSTWQFEKLK